jgi:uncharacterized FlaG/YvyC family protein
MEFKEDSMTDSISPTGSPGQVPHMAPPSMSLVTSRTPLEKDGSAPATPAVTAAVEAAIQSAANASKKVAATPPASKLELSPESLAGWGPQTGPKVMDMEEAAKAFQDYLNNLPSDLEFVPDSTNGTVVFKVVNPITHKVIRQYPPEEMVEAARNLPQSFKKDSPGILLDHNL